MGWMEWSIIGTAFLIAVLVPAICFVVVLNSLYRIEQSLAQAMKSPRLGDEAIEQLERAVVTLRMTLRDAELRLRQEASRKPQAIQQESPEHAIPADPEPRPADARPGEGQKTEPREKSRSASDDMWDEAIKALQELGNK